MPKNLYFIGDDHALDGCIAYGYIVLRIMISAPFRYVLLLELNREDEAFSKTDNYIEDTILAEKSGGVDSEALKFLVSHAYAIYGFDTKNLKLGAQSEVRQGDQYKNINYYVNNCGATNKIDNFVIIVGAAHLKRAPIDWEPLQDSNYGDGVSTTYYGAKFLQHT